VVTLQAGNPVGRVTRKLKIVVGDKLALTDFIHRALSWIDLRPRRFNWAAN
jgi:hypothetical protein